MALQLVIGNKNYSSWSMRAWLLLRFAKMPFEEIAISLYTPDARQRVRKLGGQTGLVPVLLVDGHSIWDTLAITEFVHEQQPDVWPLDRLRRARARSYAGEVHSGLNDLRAAMPVNIRARKRSSPWTTAVEADIDEWLPYGARAGATLKDLGFSGALQPQTSCLHPLLHDFGPMM